MRPDLFEGQEVRVEVETKGTLTRGMSVVDWKGQWGKASNCLVLREFLGEKTGGFYLPYLYGWSRRTRGP